MKKIISIITMFVLALTMCTSVSASTAAESSNSLKKIIIRRSEIKGSGKVETKTFDFTDFKNISATHVFDVTIEKSDKFNVEVSYDDNLAKYLNVHLKGDTLKLSLDNKHSYNNITLKATIKMPDIYDINGSGVSKFKLMEGFKFNHELNVDLSGVSKLSGKIETGNIELDVSGCSSVNLEGAGKDLSGDISGVSDVDLVNFVVDNADIEISGSSNSVISVNEKIKVDASGISSVNYKGSATIESNVSGLSNVKKIK